MADFDSIIEMELAGFLNGWTDVTADVRRAEGIRISRGLPGNTPRDLVAKTGIMTFYMDNSQDNSAGLLGYYSPGHANLRAGFDKNIGVRWSLVVNGTTIPVFTGRMTSITPTPGVHEDRVVECEAADYMNEFSKKRLNSLEMATNIDEADAFQLIVDTMPLQPRALGITAGFDTLPYVFDTLKDERSVPMSEAQKLCQSTLARVFVKSNGTLVYEPRGIRALNINANVVELTAADFPSDSVNSGSLQVTDDRGKAYNKFVATIHPRVEGTDPDVVLFAIDTPLQISAGATLTLRGLYTKPGQEARRAGGLDMLPAVSGTDYIFNTASDGSGTNVTSSVTVDTVFTANSVLFLITATVNCWATTLQARGTMVNALSNITVETEDAADIDNYGEIAFALDMPYTVDPVFATEVVQYFLFVSQQNARRAESVRLLLNGMTDERAQLMLQRDISDRIGITEVMTALPVATRTGFFINAVEVEYDEEGRVWVSWVPAISDATAYWYLEIPGLSELGSTTRLGFGLVVGHTDVAHEDSHNDTAHSDTAHTDTHSDTAHTDITHSDASSSTTTHSDTAHGDSAHTDTAHVDTAHVDSHGDSGHSDVAHDDSHSDVAHVDNHSDTAHTDTAHGDVAGQGYTNSHDDIHDDTAHGDTYHSDVAHGDYTDPDPYIPHEDSPHDDVPHVDYPHEDGSHGSHIDDGGWPHTDSPHYDVTHDDTHNDGAHSDTHNDTAHSDTAHSDSHSDTAHSDVLHVDNAHADAAHADVSHTDTVHGDIAHDDVSHIDTHGDVTHADTAHSDDHTDSPHGDAN